MSFLIGIVIGMGLYELWHVYVPRFRRWRRERRRRRTFGGYLDE